MAKKWTHTFSQFYQGETNDSFIPTGDKYLSSFNIEPVLHPRWLELAPVVVTNNTISPLDDVTSIVELPGFKELYISQEDVHYETTSKDAVLLGTGYSHASYLYNSGGTLKVYVFDSTNVIQMNEDLTVRDSATAHASGNVTAVTQAANTIVYSVADKLYQINESGILSTVLTTMYYGSIVKGLYYYNDMLYVFTVLGTDTVIYQCTYDGSVYSINYIHKVKGVSCRSVAGNGGNIYFVGVGTTTPNASGLYQTSGTSSQKIKSVSFTSSVKCSFISDNILYIIDGANLYRFGTNIPGFPNAFVKLLTHSASFTAISGEYLVTARSGGNVLQVGLSGNLYQSTGEIITMPYDSGVLWAEKNLNVIDFPYELKTGKTGASIQIQIQTNLMELNSTTTYVNIRTLSTLSNSTMRCRIDRQEILDALGNENPDWQYAKFKIILNGGLPDGSSRMQYSPKVYQDILIAGEFLNDAETYL